MLSFRNIILMSPFAVVSLLSLISRDPSKIAQSMPAASLDAKNKLSGRNIYEAKASWVSFGVVNRKLLRPTPHYSVNGPEIELWAEESRSSFLVTKSPITPNSSY